MFLLTFRQPLLPSSERPSASYMVERDGVVSRQQDACECVRKIRCKNCHKTYIGETSRAFSVHLQEHWQEVMRQDVRAYTWSTSKSAATEQNKSAVTDHAISLNHVIDWDHAKVIDRESNRMDRWIREAIHIRKEQDESMKTRGPSNFHTSMTTYCPPQLHLADNRFDEGSSSCRNVNKNINKRLNSL